MAKEQPLPSNLSVSTYIKFVHENVNKFPKIYTRVRRKKICIYEILDRTEVA